MPHSDRLDRLAPHP